MAVMPRVWEGNCPCVTDSSGLSTYWLNGQRIGDEHAAYAPDGARPGLPFGGGIPLNEGVKDESPLRRCYFANIGSLCEKTADNYRLAAHHNKN